MSWESIPDASARAPPPTGGFGCEGTYPKTDTLTLGFKMKAETPGDRIKVLVEELGLPSMAEFCRRTGLGRSLVDRVTAGHHSPRHDTLEKIKAAFPEVNLNWLVTGDWNGNRKLPILMSNHPNEEELRLLTMYRNHITGEETPEVTVTFQTQFTRPASRPQSPVDKGKEPRKGYTNRIRGMERPKF
jgi:transcriptional regulator with XRE-family HTH domain